MADKFELEADDAEGVVVRTHTERAAPLDYLMNYRETAMATGVSKATIYRMMRSGKFPGQYLVAGRARWSAREVLAWRERQRKRPAPNHRSQ
jgi:predicted DNA-binding transcriptional regulator AlpA